MAGLGEAEVQHYLIYVWLPYAEIVIRSSYGPSFGVDVMVL
jgi:hypothetical protein